MLGRLFLLNPFSYAFLVRRAVRAVANACASNPVALAIPCHRVVQKDGALAGYRWGVARKAVLLDTETHRESRDTGAAIHSTADMDHAA